MIEAARSALTRAQRPVSFSGAGLSAESGVSTFRDAQTGLWAKYDPMRLASREGFAAEPQLVIDWYNWRRRMVASAGPNPAHRALARRTDIAHISQNVDDLLERAGAANVVRLHGSLARDRCNGACGYGEHVDLADPKTLRACPTCGASLRPDVVWFGESLPAAEWTRAEALAASADVFLVIGTSAAVYPAAGLIWTARNAGAFLIVVNTEPSEAGSAADVELIGPAGRLVPEILKRNGRETDT